MKLYELNEGETKLDKVPEVPDFLGDYGAKAWRVYCRVLKQQGRLYLEYLIGIEMLCWLEEKIDTARQEIDGESKKSLSRIIREFSVEARQYRKAYELTEESRPKDGGNSIPEDTPKSKKLSGWDGE